MIGDRLRDLRSKMKLTQEELAEKIGVSRGTYAHYEINKRQPDYETLKKLATFFNVSLDYLITGEDGQVSSDDFWKEILDPETRLFFKDLYDAPEEAIREMKDIWEVIKKRRENK
uniref:Helix-turn-helix transcriptional regulator n=2 Tax=Niallia circulans TaxID=1397 RepID=A0A941GD09_NIACI|nr:helix-turn-helix transcriptional regulator [Niallia circulans]